MSPGAATPAESSAQKVFICYRREEAAAHAGRLYDAMVARFGESNVFMDVDIAPGVDFVTHITKVVSGCLVLIVVMGPHWATVTDEEGSTRIGDPEDFVRLEVETGLRRPDVTPIPVLVSGARMPRREDLPAELQPIARRNALELSDGRWGYDVGRLNGTLDDLLGESTAVATPVATEALPTPTPRPATPPPTAAPVTARAQATAAGSQPSRPGQPPGRLLLEGVLLAGFAALLARYLAEKTQIQSGTAGSIATVILRRGETWAIVGAALAAWLAYRTERSDLVSAGLRGLLVGALAGAIGGAIWALPVQLSDPDLSIAAGNPYEVISLAVTGAILGGMIGAMWRPRRLGVGMAGGAVGGALLRLILNTIGWGDPSLGKAAFGFGLAAIAIAGLTLAALLALDRQEVEAKNGTAKANAAGL